MGKGIRGAQEMTRDDLLFIITIGIGIAAVMAIIIWIGGVSGYAAVKDGCVESCRELVKNGSLTACYC